MALISSNYLHLLYEPNTNVGPWEYLGMGRVRAVWRKLVKWNLRYSYVLERKELLEQQVNGLGNVCLREAVLRSCLTGLLRQEHWSGLPFSSSRRSSQLRDRIHVACVPCTAGRFLSCWATREAPRTAGLRSDKPHSSTRGQVRGMGNSNIHHFSKSYIYYFGGTLLQTLNSNFASRRKC